MNPFWTSLIPTTRVVGGPLLVHGSGPPSSSGWTPTSSGLVALLLQSLQRPPQCSRGLPTSSLKPTMTHPPSHPSTARLHWSWGDLRDTGTSVVVPRCRRWFRSLPPSLVHLGVTAPPRKVKTHVNRLPFSIVRNDYQVCTLYSSSLLCWYCTRTPGSFHLGGDHYLLGRPLPVLPLPCGIPVQLKLFGVLVRRSTSTTPPSTYHLGP